MDANKILNGKFTFKKLPNGSIDKTKVICVFCKCKSVVENEIQLGLIESIWGRFETALLVFTLPYVNLTQDQDAINLLHLCVCWCTVLQVSN